MTTLTAPLPTGMRELTLDEIDQVEGGIAPIIIAAVITAGATLGAAYMLSKSKKGSCSCNN